MIELSPPKSLPIAVRAYAVSPQKQRSRRRESAGDVGVEDWKGIGPSEWTLVFDDETFTDAAQQLTVGGFQLRYNGNLRRAAIFYDPLSLNDEELSLLIQFADEHRLEVYTVQQFVDQIFYPYVYDRQALCVGFNLPFGLSRLAIRHGPAKGGMRGGFSYQLSPNPYRARVQTKHLNSRASFIRFAGRPRKVDDRTPTRRGHFLDLRTLAGALLSGSWSLARLAEHLETPQLKSCQVRDPSDRLLPRDSAGIRVERWPPRSHDSTSLFSQAYDSTTWKPSTAIDSRGS